MLKRVSIQNFKSLKDVTLDLQKVNLLIGPNNSGKTNFLKALEYFGKDNVPISHENDPTKIAYGHSKDNATNIQFKFDPNNTDYSFRKYDYFVLECQINSNGSVVRSNWHQDLKQVDVKSYDVKDKQYDYEYIQKRVGHAVIYNADPKKLDKPAPVGRGDESVSADASNLIAFFDRIRDEYPNAFAQIKSDLAKCIPEFTEINFQNVESTKELVKQFGDKTFKRIGLTDSRQKTIYWADELSEGTLYFVALLCIINQPNPPKILLLEEPEKGIHPRRIFEVIQFIFRLAEKKDVQIIMTTHSPIVVDMFKDMPESVFIFDKDEEGATHIKNLQYDVIEPETAKSEELGLEPPHYIDSLGDAWTVGFLGGVPK